MLPEHYNRLVHGRRHLRTTKNAFVEVLQPGVAAMLLTLLLTLCGLTGRNAPRGGPGLSGLVHEEAHPSISCHT